MKVPSEHPLPPDLEFLLAGSPAIAITESHRLMDAKEFEKQRLSVIRRGNNASVVGIIRLQLRRAHIALVERRTGSNQGWALPSGSVKPGETFLQALYREMDEELGVGLAHGSVRPPLVEVRHFEHNTTGEIQLAQVATFVGDVALGETIHLTASAREEGLAAVEAFALNDLPEHLAFGDESKIALLLDRRAA
jgi:8-oxo-dGTP pyrophosphatase MutT (NUDIX family)